MSENSLDPAKLIEELNHEKSMRLKVERDAAKYQEAEIERLFWKDIAQRAQSKKKSVIANPDILEATRKIRALSGRIQSLLMDIQMRDEDLAKLNRRGSEREHDKNLSLPDLFFNMQTDIPGLDRNLMSYIKLTETNKELSEKVKKVRAESEKRLSNNIALRDDISVLRKYKQNSVPRDMHKLKITKLQEEVERRRVYTKRLEDDIQKRKNRENDLVKRLDGREFISKEVHDAKITKLKEEINRKKIYNRRVDKEIAKRIETINFLRRELISAPKKAAPKKAAPKKATTKKATTNKAAPKKATTKKATTNKACLLYTSPSPRD